MIIMRRKDRKLDEKIGKEILKEGLFGVMTMAHIDGGGYGVPLSYYYDGAQIYFHCANQGLKSDCIQRDNRVSFVVVAQSDTLPEELTVAYRSVIAMGKATHVEGEEKMSALEGLISKYAPQMRGKDISCMKQNAAGTCVYKIYDLEITTKGNVSQ